MPYAEDPLPEPNPREIRTDVQHFEVSLQEAGQRLDNYVQKHLTGVPRSRVYRVIRKGEVRVNGRRAGPETRLQLNDRIRIPPVRVLPPAARIVIPFDAGWRFSHVDVGNAAMPALDEHAERNAFRPPKIEEPVHRCPDGAPGV